MSAIWAMCGQNVSRQLVIPALRGLRAALAPPLFPRLIDALARGLDRPPDEALANLRPLLQRPTFVRRNAEMAPGDR
jgi:hypothetical protein